jgi:hypothetical protein
MPHWSDKYIGRPYVVNTYDCAALAADIAKQEFGWEVFLPTDHGTTPLGQQRQFMRYTPLSAFPIPENEARDGDLVLMRGRGRLNHVGVFYRDTEHIAWVIHNANNVGSVIRTKCRCLGALGYAIEGVYRWKIKPS